MGDKKEALHFLYHIRESEESSGFGFDGYIGITNSLERRKKQHFDALNAGTHSNKKLQAAYNQSANGLQFFVVASGTREEVEARERLLAPKPNHHWNKQVGGGNQRGMSRDGAIDVIQRAEKSRSGRAEKGGTKSAASGKSASGSSRANSGVGTAGAGVAAGGAAEAAATESAASMAGSIGLGAAYLASGLGTAHVLNKTVLKDEPNLGSVEKESRAVGRVASYTGGSIGAVGSLTAVAVTGEFGLSAAGVASGLAGIGGTVGAGAVTGFCLTVALPAVAAAGVGYGTYRLVKWLKQ